MNDFAPKASRNGKLVLQKVLANEVSLVGNQKSEIDNVDVITFSSLSELFRGCFAGLSLLCVLVTDIAFSFPLYQLKGAARAL